MMRSWRLRGFLNQEFAEPGGYLFPESDEATSALLARLSKGALGTSEVRDVIHKLANHLGLAEALTSLDDSASISGYFDDIHTEQGARTP
jgi:hypothetical protein